VILQSANSNFLAPSGLTLRITRAHDTFNNRKPQSAKDSFKKRQGWGVGLMRWLAAALRMSGLQASKPLHP